jgi:hypothetical protein
MRKRPPRARRRAARGRAAEQRRAYLKRTAGDGNPMPGGIDAAAPPGLSGAGHTDGSTPTIVVTGQRLPSDALGNAYTTC